MIDSAKNIILFDINLNSFTLFVEYFIVISVLYFTVLLTALRENIEKFNMQKSISEFFALILLLSCFLIINDDILFEEGLSFNNSIIHGSITFFTKLLVCLSSAAFFFIIADYLNEQKLVEFEYLLILMFSILGLILLCSSFDLLTSYLAIELVSLSSYLLASFRKDSIYSVEAGLKYFIVGSISSAFFLLGTTFVYACTGTIFFADLYILFNTAIFEPIPIARIPMEDSDIFLRLLYEMTQFITLDFEEICCHDFLIIGLLLIAFGMFVKLALAPFHLWSLDVYEYSPTISVFYFATITKLSLFVFLIRLYHYAVGELLAEWQFYFLTFALISIFVGALGGLTTYRLKTLFAYSSISHMGFTFLALSMETSFGIQTLLFYLTIYIISGLCTWYIIMMLRLKDLNELHFPEEINNTLVQRYSKDIADLTLLCKANPALALGFSVTMFSLAGLPPFVGFLAKFSVFLALVKEQFYFVSSFAMLCSVVSTFYYIRIVKIIYFEDALVGNLFYPIAHEKAILLSILIFSLFFLFVNPSFFYLFVYDIVDSAYLQDAYNFSPLDDSEVIVVEPNEEDLLKDFFKSDKEAIKHLKEVAALFYECIERDNKR